MSPAASPANRRAALAAVLALALCLRLWTTLTHTYVALVDETFQYFEQAHRIVYGSGVVPWEFIDGIRSWLMPGIVAVIMAVLSPFENSPNAYVLAVRLCFVATSLIVPYVGFRFGEQRFGRPGAVAAGVLGALSYEVVYFAPVVMTEALAAHLALLALWLGESAPARGLPAARRLALAGMLFGFAAVLRYQYAPALALAVLWQHGRNWREMVPLFVAGLLTVLLFGGVLDWLTYGAPFQTVWLNFTRNAMDGISAAMGTQPWYYPVAYFLAAWGPLLPVLVLLAVTGALAAPSLALMTLATLALHMMSPHKELRFTYLALASVPLLIGFGLGAMLQMGQRAFGLPAWACGGAAAALLAASLAGGEALVAMHQATPLDAWHRDRSVLLAFAAARDVPGLCGLGVRSEPVYRSGGYTYLHRDVPIYFETFEAVQHLEGSEYRLRLRVMQDGRAVPQFPGPAIIAAAGRFNVLIGHPSDQLPGFDRVACFGAGTIDDRTVCVFRRPGGCG